MIAATTGIQTELRRWYRAESAVICEVTAPESREGGPAVRGDGEPLRLAWSGQHASGKALPLLFRALKDLPADVGWRLVIYGSGPKTEDWKRLANRLGVDRGCVWVGHIPREQAIAGLADAHLFVITSLKDLTSTVLLEALSQQVPVICPDHCGFSDVVNAECGIKLPIDTPEVFVTGLGDAITGLFRDEARRRQLADGRWHPGPDIRPGCQGSADPCGLRASPRQRPRASSRESRPRLAGMGHFDSHDLWGVTKAGDTAQQTRSTPWQSGRVGFRINWLM